HYLLPILPGLALYLAGVLNHKEACLRGRLFGGLLLVAGLALAALPYVAAHAHSIAMLDRMLRDGRLSDAFLHVVAGVWPAWGALAVALGLWPLLYGRKFSSPRPLALASVATASIGMLALAQGIGPYVDVSAAAAHIRQAQDSNRSIAHLAWHHGLF